MIAPSAIPHQIAKEILGFVSLYLSSRRTLFLIPLFLYVKTIIPNFGQFSLAMGSNGNVTIAIPNEGDCLVFVSDLHKV
jgi:hypothetical protein